MVVEWDPPLQFRRGSPQRLCGIEIYHDFPWSEFFPDGRAQFKNGLCLAKLVISECPTNKTPALLLTNRPDVDEVPIETETHFAAVVNLPRYLEQTPDAAASYYAHRIQRGITSIGQLQAIARRPDVIDAVLAENLDVDRIGAWAAGNADRMAQLRAIAEAPVTGTAYANPEAVVRALDALGSLDADIVAAIEGLLGKDMDREARVRFLKALTGDPTGRSVTSEVLGDRLADRLADVRRAAEGFTSLLETPTSTETDIQEYIQEHPWLVGLDYVRVRPRKEVPRGQLDFILERYDGFHDLLELKGPHDDIIIAPDAVDGVPPPASQFALSRALAQALAQVHVYRDVLTEDADTVAKRYGLPRTRFPRLIVVIGQSRQLAEHRARVLRDFNLSLHRVEIVPYDILADRARAFLDNVEKYLSLGRSEASG